jgi:hypothetical protein
MHREGHNGAEGTMAGTMGPPTFIRGGTMGPSSFIRCCLSWYFRPQSGRISLIAWARSHKEWFGVGPMAGPMGPPACPDFQVVGRPFFPSRVALTHPGDTGMLAAQSRVALIADHFGFDLNTGRDLA